MYANNILTISSQHLQKLTNEIDDIRDRALRDIYLKLRCNINFKNPREHNQELLKILFQSFENNRFNHFDIIAYLLDYLLLKSEFRIETIENFGINNILQQLNHIKFEIDQDNVSKIDALIDHLEKLSLNYKFDNNEIHQENKIEQFHIPVIKKLQYYKLIESDLNILTTIEQQLENDQNNLESLNFFNFFHDVILNDFPAETFLQNPTILLLFYDYIEKTSSNQIQQSIFTCLTKITDNLRMKLHIQYDVTVNSTEILNESNSNEDLSHEFSIQKFITKTLGFCFKFFTDDIDESYKKTRLILIILTLIKKLFCLLHESVTTDIWNYQWSKVVSDILDDLRNCLLEMGNIFNHFKIKFNSSTKRLTHLYFTFISIDFIDKFIPKDFTCDATPRLLKDSLANLLSDTSIQFLYPTIYKKLIDIVLTFGENYSNFDAIRFQNYLIEATESINTTLSYLNDKSTLSLTEKIHLIRKSSLSLNFHKTYEIIEQYFNDVLDSIQNYDELSIDIMNEIQETILNFMNSNDSTVRQITYENCFKILQEANDLNCNNKLVILFQNHILFNIITNGLCDADFLIQNICENIIINLLKFDKFIILRNWNDNHETISYNLPIMLCHANHNSEIGKSVLRLIDPEISKMLKIPELEVIKGNLSLLFSQDGNLRTDAIMYVIWMLISETDCDKKLPKTSSLQNNIESDICVFEKTNSFKFEFSKNHHLEKNFIRNLEYLTKSNVDRSIKRSALNQLKYQLQNTYLHEIFFQYNGFNILLEILNEALIEDEFNTYPDSAIPLIACLKILATYHPEFRKKLAQNSDLLYNLLRSLFLFQDNAEFRADVSQLLFLIIFCNFIKNKFEYDNVILTIREDVISNFHIPFACDFEDFTETKNPIDKLMDSDWGRINLRFIWNSQMYKSFENYITQGCEDNTNSSISLNQNEIDQIQKSSIILCSERLLFDIENAVSCGSILQCLNGLLICFKINEFQLGTNSCKIKVEQLLHLPWERTLSRFLISNVRNDLETKITTDVIKVLQLLVTCYKATKKVPWISRNLTDINYVKENVQVAMESNLELAKKYLELMQHVITLEQNLEGKTCWVHIIDMLSQNFMIVDNEDFQDLSLVSIVLKSILNITSYLGWSEKLTYKNVLINNLILRLSDLMVFFQPLKFEPCSGSVIGLGIVSNILIILYQLICEANYFDIKNYDLIIVRNSNFLKWSYSMLDNQDMIIRTTVMQLFAEYCKWPENATILVQNCQQIEQNIWKKSLGILLNVRESYLVKEASAEFLTNLSNHSKSDHIYYSHFQQITKIDDLIFYLEKWGLFLQLKNIFVIDSINLSNVLMLKNIINFLNNLLRIFPTKITLKLNEINIISILFNDLIQIENTKNNAKNQINIFEFKKSTLIFINSLIKLDKNILKSIQYSKEYLQCLIKLLDSDQKYDFNSAQLIYLRNRIWTQSYRLLYTIIVTMQSTNIEILNLVFNKVVIEQLLVTISVSIENGTCTELQQSALMFTSALFMNELKYKQFYDNSNSLDMLEIQLCRQLLDLYYIQNYDSIEFLDFFIDENCSIRIKNTCYILSALTSLISVSNEAKSYAIDDKFLEKILKRFSDYSILFELKNHSSRNSLDKKLFQLLLKEVQNMIKAINNFAYDNDTAKILILNSNFITIEQKFWKWFLTEKEILIDVLKMNSTLTESFKVFETLQSTKKVTFSQILTNLIVSLILKEMDLFSRSHDSQIIKLSFEILQNCTASQDCRTFILKSNFLSCILRLNPAYTKKQKQWQIVEYLWLKFLYTYSLFQEGQISILNIKSSDVLSLFIDLARNSQSEKNRELVFEVLKNLVFHTKNRLRFLNSNEFLQLVYDKLNSSTINDIEIAAKIIWALIANNQRAKFCLKSKGFDLKLSELIEKLKLTQSSELLDSHFNTLKYVHNLLNK